MDVEAKLDMDLGEQDSLIQNVCGFALFSMRCILQYHYSWKWKRCICLLSYIFLISLIICSRCGQGRFEASQIRSWKEENCREKRRKRRWCEGWKGKDCKRGQRCEHEEASTASKSYPQGCSFRIIFCDWSYFDFLTSMCFISKRQKPRGDLERNHGWMLL